MKEIHCECGKLIAKQREDGTIVLWCKSCRKEVPLEIDLSFKNAKSIKIPKIKLEVEPYEPVDKR